MCSCCAGPLDRGREKADLGELPLRGAASPIEGEKRLLLGELLLYAGLLDREKEEAASVGCSHCARLQG